MKSPSETATFTTSPSRFQRLITSLITLISICLLIALVKAMTPQELTDLKDRSSKLNSPARDLSVVLREASERGYAVTLRQQEINHWLRKVVEGKQNGVNASFTTLKSIYVRVEESHVELIAERDVFGKTLTFSTYFAIENQVSGEGQHLEIIPHGGVWIPGTQSPMCGGRFGKLPIPQGFTYLMLPLWNGLHESLKSDIDFVTDHMVQIRMKKAALEFDPNLPEHY